MLGYVRFGVVGLPMVGRFMFKFHQLAIATAYIWVLEKDNIGAPLKKILIHWGSKKIDTLCPTPFKKL